MMGSTPYLVPQIMYSPEWIRTIAGTSEAQRLRSEAAAEAWVNEVMQNSKLKSYTQGKTAESIQNQVRSALAFSLPSSSSPFTKQPELTDYHFVEHLDELKVGRFIRWITSPGSADANLTNGGVVVRVQEDPVANAKAEAETNARAEEEYYPIERYSPVPVRARVQWKSTGKRRIMGTFLLENCVVFQKLSNEEILILSADKYHRASRNPFSEISRKPSADAPPFLLNRNRNISWNEDSSSDDDSSDDDSSDDD